MILCEPLFYFHVLYTHKNSKFNLTFWSVDESSMIEVKKGNANFSIVQYFMIWRLAISFQFAVDAYIFKIMAQWFKVIKLNRIY